MHRKHEGEKKKMSGSLFRAYPYCKVMWMWYAEQVVPFLADETAAVWALSKSAVYD